MLKNITRLFAVACFCCVVSASAAMAQDFERSYRVGANGSIRLRNVSGDIHVTGYDGDAVVVRGTCVGRDRDRVEVVDESTNNQVNISVRYPDNSSTDASVNFEIQVPRAARTNISQIATASGNIELRNINGDVRVNTASGNLIVESVSGNLRASTASGNVRVRNVSGEINTSSASGDVDAEIAQLTSGSRLTFSSASGDVHVKLPSGTDADVALSTASGSVRTSFPIEVRRSEHGSGEWARGRLGSGTNTVRITSASGDVHLESN